VNNLLLDFSSRVQGRSPGRGSGGRSPPVKSSYKQIVRIFGSNSHRSRNTDYWKRKLQSTTPVRK